MNTNPRQNTEDTEKTEGTESPRPLSWLFRHLFPDYARDLVIMNIALREKDERLFKAVRDLRDAKSHQLAVTEAVRQQAEAEGWRTPEEQLDAEELSAAFDVEADEDLWRAVHQVLDVAIQEAIEESSQAPAAGKFTAEDRGFASGGVDFLREFQRTLIEKRASARVKAAAAAAEEKEE